MEGTVLSVASRAVVEACERLGLDGDELLSEVGLGRDQVMDPDRRLPAAQADALWTAAFTRARDPHLALHAAEALPFGAYKVIDFLCTQSEDVASAYRRVTAYFRIIDVRAVLELVEDPPAIEMRTASGAEPPPAAQEYTFAALIRRMALAAPPGWGPIGVELTFEAPTDPAEHERVLMAPVAFGAPTPRIVFDADTWSASISGSQPELLGVLEDHAQRLLAELPMGDDLAGRVRAAIAEELSDGNPSIAHVAKRLATSERTLQRRLRESGLSFAKLLDDTRFAVARAHLRDRDVSLAEVAFLIGFSDQSTFTRAFRRWAGKPPGAWRASIS